MAETKAKVRTKGGLAPILKGFRPAVPATVGAFALTFLFAAMMPMAWIASLCWNLYLDLIHPIFEPPLGNAARVGIALLFATGAALVALVVALALVKPAVKGNRAMNARVAARARKAEDGDDEVLTDSQALRRRRVDGHPDAPPVAPIRAARDLPAGGLMPAPAAGGNTPSVDYGLTGSTDDIMPLELDQAMLLDAEAPFDLGPGQMVVEPAQPPFAGPSPVAAPTPAPVLPDPADASLGAMVARFEAGLDRRRNRTGPSFRPDPSVPANEDVGADPPADLALEAALSTLQRMNRSAIG